MLPTNNNSERIASHTIAVDARLKSSRAIIFDYYNTLVVDDIVVPDVWQHLNALGYVCSRDLQAMFEPDAFDGLATPHLGSNPDHDMWCRENWRQLIRMSGVPDSDLESILQTVLNGQAKYSAKAAPFVREVIHTLKKAGYRIGLCSNWETRIESCIKKAGLDICDFDAITTSIEVGARKPHIHMFLDICKKLNIAPSEGSFVGDNWATDVVGALRAGLLPIWITHGRLSKGLRHLVPEFESVKAFGSYVQLLR